MFPEIDVEQVIDDTLALAAVPGPTGHEEARGNALFALLRAVPGLAVGRDDAGNVLARVPAAHAAGEQHAVVVAAHLDTVFGSDVPLHPRRERNALHGPGIGDNTVAVAALPALARALLGSPMPQEVVVAGTVGEEGLGNLRGARALLRSLPATCLIALEGHGIDHLITRAVGSTRLLVTCTAPGGHSWQDRGAVSAVHALARAAATVAEQVPQQVPGCSANVGVFSGGTGINVIAAHAELQLDLRASAASVLAAAEACARDVLRDVVVAAGASLTITPLGNRPAGSLPDDHPLIVAAQEARAAAGLPRASLIDGSTDANAAYEARMPGITVGLTRGGGIHRTDEHIECEPIGAGIAAALGLIRRAAALPPS